MKSQLEQQYRNYLISEMKRKSNASFEDIVHAIQEFQENPKYLQEFFKWQKTIFKKTRVKPGPQSMKDIMEVMLK